MTSERDAENVNHRPWPGDFESSSAYLRMMVRHLKHTDPKFSYRYFSKKAGFASPSTLKLVIDGQRRLAFPSIKKFARALQLAPREAEAFEALVLLSQATNDDDRNEFYRRLHRHAPATSTISVLEKAQYDVYTSWYTLPIKELAGAPGFREDAAWIARQLHPPITPAQARDALKSLEQLGMLERDPQGRLRSVKSKMATARHPPPLATRNYHRHVLRTAAEALDTLSVDERHVSSVTINLTADQYKAVEDLIEQFRSDVLDLVEDAPPSKTPRKVHQIAFAVIPVTRAEE